MATLSIVLSTVLNGHSKKGRKICFQNQLLLNAGQKYCRMLQGEHSAILSTFIKLPFVIKTFVLSMFELLFFYIGYTVYFKLCFHINVKLKFLPYSHQSTTPNGKLHEFITGFGCTHYSHLECCAAHPPF